MNDPGLYEWMALRRAAGGGMAKVAGVYLDHGRPVPEHVAAEFDRLVWSGLLVIADGDPLWELRRISLSDAGQQRYIAVRPQHPGGEIEVPGSEFGRGGTCGPDEWAEPTA